MSTNNIIRDLILSRTNNGYAVFRHYIRAPWKDNQKFYNPLYDDTKPSCKIYRKESGKYTMYDHGEPSYSGDCFYLVGALNGLDSNKGDEFEKILRIIDQDLGLGCYSTNYIPQQSKPKPKSKAASKPKQPIVESPIETPEEPQEPPIPIVKEYSIKQREFTQQDLAFWGENGIDRDTLVRFNVVAIDEFRSISNEGNKYTIYGSIGRPVFGYHFDTFIKIYNPNAKSRFLYGGEKLKTYCFGLKQLPPKGDVLYITGGEKDVLSLSARGFNAISFNSETENIPEAMIKHLSYTFKHIVLLYDMDKPGLDLSALRYEQLSQFGVKRMLLPLPGIKQAKDISDYFRLGNSIKSFRLLLVDILDSMYSETISILKSCEVNFNAPPPTTQMLISVNDVPLGTAGNLLCVTGGEGTGKSNFSSALLAGAICDDGSDIDTLGLTIEPNVDQQAVILYDTEQSEAQLHKNCVNIMRRSQVKQVPENFKAYSLTSMSRNMRLKRITESMDRLFHYFGGIYMVVIDGIADLIRGANDESDSIAIVEELYRLAGIYNTCIICVLHFIPSGVKLRGHIGSELQRKAAAIVSIEKESKTEVSVIKAIKVRDGSPLDVPLMQFKWNKEKMMHCFIGEKSAEEKESRKIVELTEGAIKIFENRSVISYNDLCVAVKEYFDIKDRAAKSYIRDMRDREIVINEPVEESKMLMLGDVKLP